MDPAAASDENGAAVAGTDAAPPSEGPPAAVTPEEKGATGGTQASTDNESKPKPKTRKSGRSVVKKAPAPVAPDSAAVSGTTPDPVQTQAADAAPPPVATQEAPVQTAAPTMTQNNQPEQTDAARTPASPEASPAHAAAEADEMSGEASGGLLEQLMAYRTALMAAVGIALIGGGGFAFWKKRQAAI
jgi:LPXTG-motif cell wall-anchored protein